MSRVLVWCVFLLFCLLFCKKKSAYEMRMSDWSSDVCSSDLTLLNAAAPAPSCYSRTVNEWLCMGYFEDRGDELMGATLDHLTITAAAVLLGLALALPLALAARRFERLESLILGFCTGLYTLPSLALFPLIVPFTGLSRTTVVVGLAIYSLTCLVRHLIQGPPAVSVEALPGGNAGVRAGRS